MKALPTDYQSFIHRSRYARYVDEKGRRESWEETVDRLMSFWMGRIPSNVIGTSTFKELRLAILNLEVMPSMRSLMTAGLALDKDHVASFNCAYTAIDNIRCFDEIMYILMCGTGVGFSVERQYINKLPEVAEEFHESESTIRVRDSKIGWSSAYKELIAMLYSGNIPKWDDDGVRPVGERLKTFGGRASGPEPLRELYQFTIETFQAAAGRKLNSIEVHDLVCKIAQVIVVGGVRRSALISLSNLTDQRMRSAKSGEWYLNNQQRSLANNSVAYTEKPDIGIFMEEWNSLYRSKSGERGIFNRVAANKQALASGRREPYSDWGINPCLHPDSLIQTIDGEVKIKDITQPTHVYTMGDDGRLTTRKCSASWVSKRNAETLKITIASGKKIVCTPDHKIYIDGLGWKEAQDLVKGDRVVHLQRSRRGAKYSGVKLTTQGKVDFVMEHRMVWEATNGPIPADHDIDHENQDTYDNVSSNLRCMSHSDHAMHTCTQHPNNHMVSGKNDNHPRGYGFISPKGSKKGKKTIVDMPERLKSGLHQYATITNIEAGPITDVYDLTVEDTHNFISDFVVVHNCSEIILRSKQFCNLTEVVVRKEDSLDDLKRKVRLATILGTLQATLTDFRYLSKRWKDNTEEEALLGVSLTGIMDHPVLKGQSNTLTTGHARQRTRDFLKELKNVAIDTNKRYANKLGIPQAAAITCVKPSGTVSQLVDSASGIHPRFARRYIRTVRASRNDPLAEFMVQKGFPVEADRTEPSNLIFSFPVESPDGAVCRDGVSAIDQLELWKLYQEEWCEHKPSITVYIRECEWLKVGAWVYENFDILSGVAFLPHSDHAYAQAPYQDIDEEGFKEFCKQMPTDIDWDEVQEGDDFTTASQEMACTGNSCEL